MVGRISSDTLATPFLGRLHTQSSLVSPDALAATEPSLVTVFFLLGRGCPLASEDTTDDFGGYLELVGQGRCVVGIGELGVERADAGEGVGGETLARFPAFGELFLECSFLGLPE